MMIGLRRSTGVPRAQLGCASNGVSLFALLIPFILLWSSGGNAAAVRLKAAGVPIDFIRWHVDENRSIDIPELPSALVRGLKEGGDHIAVPLRHERIEVKRNADVETTRVISRLLLTQEGMHKSSNIRVVVDAHREVMEVLAAYTLSASKRRFNVSADSVQVRTVNDGNIFTNAFELTVPFSNAKPGSTLVLETRVRTSAKRSALPWSTIYFPRQPFYVDHFGVDVSWAKGADRPVLANDVPNMRCLERKPRTVSCSVRKLDRFEFEERMPSMLDLLPQLAVSAVQSWSSLGQRVRSYTMAKRTSAPAVKRAFDGIVGVESPQEKFARLHSFVARKIRYLGLEQEDGAFVPRPSDVTLARGYGDCKDKTVLFLDFLKLAGIEAWPVLVASSRFDVTKLIVPAPVYFDHMIACADLGEAQPVCVDLTDEAAVSSELSPAVYGAVSLPLDGKVFVPSTLTVPKYSVTYHAKTTAESLQDGSLRELRRNQYEGLVAAGLRKQLSVMREPERIQWIGELFRKIARAEEKPTDVTVQGLNPDAPNLVLAATVVHKKPYDLADGQYHQSLDWALLESLASLYVKERKHHPLHILGVRVVSDYTLIGAVRDQAIPNAPLTQSGQFGRFSRDFKDGRMHSVLQVPRQVISIANVARFTEFLEKTHEKAQVLLAIKKRGFFERAFSSSSSGPLNTEDEEAQDR
jgi:hypothetical protein